MHSSSQATLVATASDWPELPSSEWVDTIETLHMWSQIVGKIRMELSPWTNHSWSVPLYVTPTDVLAIVGAVNLILGKRNRLCNLVRQPVNRDLYVEVGEGGENLGIELSYALRL